MLALARFGDTPCVLLAQDRRGQTELHPLGPAALREARRGMRLAEELRLPLLTVIDTPGAALSVEAEEGGLAGEIARCLADLVTPRGADAVADARAGHRRRRARAAAGRPGGRRAARLALAAAARGRQRDRAPRPRPRRRRWPARSGCGRSTCSAAGIVDVSSPERPDAADEPEEFCRRVGQVLRHELAWLRRQDVRGLVASRPAHRSRPRASACLSRASRCGLCLVAERQQRRRASAWSAPARWPEERVTNRPSWASLMRIASPIRATHEVSDPRTVRGPGHRPWV